MFERKEPVLHPCALVLFCASVRAYARLTIDDLSFSLSSVLSPGNHSHFPFVNETTELGNQVVLVVVATAFPSLTVYLSTSSPTSTVSQSQAKAAR